MKTITMLESVQLEDTLSNSTNILEQFKAEIGNKAIVLYGASMIGVAAYRSLTELGFRIANIFDRNAEQIKNIDGFPVNTPNLLSEITDETLVYISASSVTSKFILSDISGLGNNFTVTLNGEHVTEILQSVMCAKRRENNRNGKLSECGICGVLDNHCPVFRKRGEDIIGSIDNNGQVKSKLNSMIGYTLGKICSLNCKHCCESIPLYSREQRKFIPYDVVINDINRLASVCEYITKVEFIGGEPFMHPKLADIISSVLKIKNVAFVQIFTNGTIIPKDELCQLFANERLAIHISEYSHVTTPQQKIKLEQTKALFDKHKVDYVVGSGKKWLDFSSYEYRDDDSSLLKKRYEACFLHWCNRLSEGELFVCPHHYAGVNLGYIKRQQDVIRIHELNEEELASAIDVFKSIEYSEACKYCKMPWDAPVIYGAEQ
jgi:organic radical activating enzyme